MIIKYVHSVRRAAAFAAFVLALILLTGTPAKVREITLEEDTALSEAEARKAHPDVVPLPMPGKTGPLSVEEAIERRRSIREFTDAPVLLKEVGQLLWAAQGITDKGGHRAAPSAGATYPIELFVVAGNVDGLGPAVYHYNVKEHSLEVVRRGDLRGALSDEALSQEWMEDAALSIVIGGVYSRAMERYEERGIRYVHVEVGAVAENVYLQATTLGLGTTLVGAFDDDGVKELLRMEGVQPFGIMPVGVPSR